MRLENSALLLARKARRKSGGLEANAADTITKKNQRRRRRRFARITKMILGIINCDENRGELAAFGDYPRMFAELFRRADPQTKIRAFDARRGKYPANIGDCDGYVISGSRHSANDDLPWIAPLKQFVRRAYRARTPIVGICFGHQIAAAALGGRVVKWPGGWGVGMQQWRILRDEKWLKSAPKNLRLLASHQDQVSVLPRGAKRIAASDFCPNAMFAVGGRVLGVQGHPEFSRDFCEAIINLRRKNVLSPGERKAALASLSKSDHSAAFARWALSFIKAAKHGGAKKG
jgi:GMP synthase-like glutamine amidotransferase